MIRTLQEISDDMNVTRERVRQILEKASKRLFKKMSNMYPEFDAFEMASMIFIGLRLNEPGAGKKFFGTFPNDIQRKIRKDALKHYPCLSKKCG